MPTESTIPQIYWTIGSINFVDPRFARKLWSMTCADVNICTPFRLCRKPPPHRQDVDLFVAQDIVAAHQHVIAVRAHARSGLANDDLAIPGNNIKYREGVGKLNCDGSVAHFDFYNPRRGTCMTKALRWTTLYGAVRSRQKFCLLCRVNNGPHACNTPPSLTHVSKYEAWSTAPMKESKVDPTSPLSAPSRINGACDACLSPAVEEPSAPGGSASLNSQPKNTKASRGVTVGHQQRRGNDEEVAGEWAVGIFTFRTPNSTR